jgi:hypothetical protein
MVLKRYKVRIIFIWLRIRKVKGSCEHSIYSLVAIKRGEYFGYLSNYKDTKKDAAT